MCFNLLFVEFLFVFAFLDFGLQIGNLAKLPLKLVWQFNGRKTGFAGTIDPCERFHCQCGFDTAHGRRDIVFKAPDPFIQPLENHILFDKVALDFRHCQIIGRIIPPKA